MNYRLKLVTAPTVEPVTVTDMKNHSRIDIDDDDVLLDTYIQAAREAVESELKRALITQTYDWYFDGWPSFPLEFPFGKLQSITSIKYYDESDNESTYSSANYQVSTGDPGRVTLKTGSSLPSTTLRPMDGVIIRFVCGYGDGAGNVPDSIRAAIQLHAATMYEHRELFVTGTIVVPIGDTVQRLLFPNRFHWSRRGVA